MKSKGKVKKQSKIKVMEINMMRIDPGAIGFTSGFSQEHKYSTVAEQITVEKMTELSIVMRISRYDHVYTLVEKGPVVPVRKGLLSRFLNRD